jgi:enoyl-CoA hydratase
MSYNTLLTDQQNDILTITLNRPEVLNALNKNVLMDLHEVLTRYYEDTSVRGIILTGAGAKSFVAGADIAEITALDAETAMLFSTTGQKLFDAIEQYPKPILAAVNGFALGGGCELAMACHLRVASENASFGQPEINLGIIPGYGGTQRLPRLIGKTKAVELLLTGDRISAQEALALGLVNKVVPAEQLISTANEMMQKILTKSSLAIRYILDAVNAHYDPTRDGYATEIHNFVHSCISEDGREGTQAFVEKRKPTFTGK